jgi:mannose-6-phosphate isomerase
MKLLREYVEKPWGRDRLPAPFHAPPGQRIGEVWFTGSPDEPLLVKYIFTSERLSIQVHPNDEQARERGLVRGKSECWYILDADEGATLGLGLRKALRGEALREAALDGSIEELMEWKAVRPGDFFYIPAGTIHAIGAGISLLEFQQNSDVTYRLYDYGRPRELHLDDAIAVAKGCPYPFSLATHVSPGEEGTLVEGPHFILMQTRSDALTDRRRWVVPIEGQVRSGEDVAAAGECLLLEPGADLATDGARILIGASA